MRQICYIACMCLLLSASTKKNEKSLKGMIGKSSKVDAGPFVSENGQINLPLDQVDYRKDWSFMGSWLVTAKNDANGVHDTFTQPEAVEHFRKTGKFADGTVLIKEIRAYQQSAMTTGPGVYHASENRVWFVMIKDGQNKYKGKNWGDGWGWALFDNKTRVNKSKNYATDCKGCHVPVKSADWVYSKYYPTLFKDPFKFKGVANQN